MKKVAIALLIMAAVASGGRVLAQPSEDSVRDFFSQFVAAQNAHDATKVKSMLWSSPQVLFFSRGLEIRGTEAVAARFSEYYQGTWQVEPDMSKFHVALISDHVAQILVPIVFTRGLPGAEPQSSSFLISQTLVRDSDGWKLASIMPIANTQFKQ
ncbi:YybH family protein [Bradyrhizobium iriomotense]|uniref:YybH family protein n=1 Tax=Bradyrhizobium iriomotense TaxID=441950 RepID=UPI001B8A7E3F|nr:DUF4440 domain-containing protein [Bradyrhizobium iriomotense]MBR0782233.1 DUF4440 domain-containing protein [Bradyrhizobium iriomotense]